MVQKNDTAKGRYSPKIVQGIHDSPVLRQKKAKGGGEETLTEERRGRQTCWRELSLHILNKSSTPAERTCNGDPERVGGKERDEESRNSSKRRSCDPDRPVSSLHNKDPSAVFQPLRNRSHLMEITCWGICETGVLLKGTFL